MPRDAISQRTGKRFEVCREPETREGKNGDRAHDTTQTDDHDGGIEEGPLHLVIEEMVMDALRATTGGAWLALRRAARMSRAQRVETLGTVACEIHCRWGWVIECKRVHDDI